jgi:hypothetical protein
VEKILWQKNKGTQDKCKVATKLGVYFGGKIKVPKTNVKLPKN